jgi:hypothetical protein
MAARFGSEYYVITLDIQIIAKHERILTFNRYKLLSTCDKTPGSRIFGWPFFYWCLLPDRAADPKRLPRSTFQKKVSDIYLTGKPSMAGKVIPITGGWKIAALWGK